MRMTLNRLLCPACPLLPTRYNSKCMDIYEEVVRLRRLGQKCALATIVQVDGSIPSYESAKLLVREDGSMMARSAVDAWRPRSGTPPVKSS